MGKNGKNKQVVDQAQIESRDNGQNAKAPEEFLTSDDFQVVHNRRHHSKKSPDDQEDKVFLSRSRCNSSQFTDGEEDLVGCHSSFWTVRSQKLSSEDIIETVSSAAVSESAISCRQEAVHTSEKLETSSSSNGCVEVLENGSGDCLSQEIENFQKLSLNENVPNVNQTPVSESLESSLSEGNGKKLIQELESEDSKEKFLNKDRDIIVSQIVGLEENGCKTESLEKETQFSLQIEGTNDTHISASEEAISGSEDTNEAKTVGSESHSVKTHAQKKQEKKARNNKQKKCANGIGSSKIEGKVRTNSSSSDFSEAHAVNEDESKHEKDDCSKKDRKRPNKKQLAAIHEAVRKAKEEEERRKLEAETQRRLAEEAEKQAQEMQRLEQERKEKKKLKEKQKREKLKAEGRILPKSLKQSRARLAATLEAFRQLGVDVPQMGEKKPHDPALGNSKTSNRMRLDSCQSDSGTVNTTERHKSESLSSQESNKDSLSDLPSSFDSKESWDLNEIRAVEIMAVESDVGHYSCSEESDAIDEERSTFGPPKAKDIVAAKLKDSLEKSNLAKFKTGNPNTIVSEEKKDSARLRSPVICVLGHVDTGKTKLLDYIRKTHVQDSEAGGITQQIGATMIPQDALKEKCKMVKNFSSLELKVPGLLVIDTPGHESFRNLRSRGTSVCDIAILVVDIMHGLEPQTLESINLLKKTKTPFVVALNKIDRIYGWKSDKDEDIENVINKQNPTTLREFKKRSQDIVLQFANQCLNAVLFYENMDPRTFVSMIPTSAISGDGMGNLLSLITQLTQSLMHKRLTFSQELQATVLEVKVIPGLGTTIDVILVNGSLHEGDTIVLAGHEGPIVSQIRSLLMPRPLKELRVKNAYIEYKTVEGSQGVKITAKDLDKTVAGLPLFVAKNHNEIENLKLEMTDLLNQIISNVKISERGVFVQASTLGSLEALLEYLTSSSIPYFGMKIGPVVKRDVMKASIMLEHDKMYATILAFDVKVEKDAQDLADSLGVKIFSANIIYHLFDAFVNYRDEAMKKREEVKHHVVFPCILKIQSKDISISDHTIELNVMVEAGNLRENTPLCVSTKGNLDIGAVSLIEVDHQVVACAKEGQEARITIVLKEEALSKMSTINLDDEDYLISRVTRQSIELCKEYYRDEFDETDWHLMGELKKMLHVHA
ncbi:eukaryotic translation initiation factor 5B [Trichonephila inaurata madagascariensis]|uniref:Eukaryotic translation initiation factor 5B n=1 Tax=Trichonephila inaurata madagascariensis TaxID=2747483 RepID=A0A8X6WSF0_9ARAC|nr:eukaryotic translation initiation factor 5B [Trichonephila inaurata madagascariensis]